jgi:acid stress-induced BolA-like protein IbaG/YrbA
MDVREKVEEALRHAFDPEFIQLEDDDGISGYLVSSKFRRMEFIDRQTMIYEALRNSPIRLKPGEIRRVVAIAALTPEEHVGHAAH